jgi:iron complex transport system substrate-binding protein
MSAHSRRVGVTPILIAVLSFALVACSNPVSSAPGSSPAPSPTVATTGVPTPEATDVAAFPATITDDEGTSIALAAEPQKIVSLTPATTEILFALGAGDRVVATDDGSDYPEAAVALPDVAKFDSVDVEKVVALEPDLVVAGGLGFTPVDSIAKLRSLKVPVMVVYAKSVDGVYHDIELLGTATGTADAARTLTTAMRADMTSVSDAVNAEGTKPRVYYEVGYDDVTGAIYAPADDSFLAQMVTLTGADAITTGDPASFEIPLEKLIERDPQIIVLGTNPFYNPTPAAVMARPGWIAMTAVKNKDVRPVRDIEINRPGPRLPLGLRNLAAAIWPDVTLPAPPG